MATKNELKQRVKELDNQLVEAWLERDTLKAEIDTLKANITRAKDTEIQYRHWYQTEQRRAEFYFKCMSKIRYILALDTVEQLTHRQRNDKLRELVCKIGMWMDTVIHEDKSLDYIPF